MVVDRLETQLAFILETEKLKQVFRQTLLSATGVLKTTPSIRGI